MLTSIFLSNFNPLFSTEIINGRKLSDILTLERIYMKMSTSISIFLISISSLASGVNNSLDTTHENQGDSATNRNYGVQLTQSFLYPTFHTSPSFVFILKKHEIFMGPEFTKLQRGYLWGDPADKWKQENWGLHIGYKYRFHSPGAKADFSLQTDFSLYQTQFHEYQLGPPYDTEHRKTIAENSAGLGINYYFTKRFIISGTLGIGSAHGFFLMPDQLILYTSAGIEYRIK